MTPSVYTHLLISTSLASAYMISPWSLKSENPRVSRLQSSLAGYFLLVASAAVLVAAFIHGLDVLKDLILLSGAGTILLLLLKSHFAWIFQFILSVLESQMPLWFSLLVLRCRAAWLKRFALSDLKGEGGRKLIQEVVSDLVPEIWQDLLELEQRRLKIKAIRARPRYSGYSGGYAREHAKWLDGQIKGLDARRFRLHELVEDCGTFFDQVEACHALADDSADADARLTRQFEKLRESIERDTAIKLETTEEVRRLTEGGDSDDESEESKLSAPDEQYSAEDIGDRTDAKRQHITMSDEEIPDIFAEKEQDQPEPDERAVRTPHFLPPTNPSEFDFSLPWGSFIVSTPDAGRDRKGKP